MFIATQLTGNLQDVRNKTAALTLTPTMTTHTNSEGTQPHTKTISQESCNAK